MVEENLLDMFSQLILKIVALYITYHAQEHLNRMVLSKGNTGT